MREAAELQMPAQPAFPSPDHNYAISPVKDEGACEQLPPVTDIKQEQDVKTEVLVEDEEEEQEQEEERRSYRCKVKKKLPKKERKIILRTTFI